MVTMIRGAMTLLFAIGLSFGLGVAPVHAAPIPAVSYTGSLTSGAC